MKYFDPERPKLAQDAPQLLGTLTALPGIRFEPQVDGSWIASCFLPSEGFARFSTSLHEARAENINEIEEILFDYLNDPEKLFAERFKWKRPEVKSADQDLNIILNAIGGKENGIE